MGFKPSFKASVFIGVVVVLIVWWFIGLYIVTIPGPVITSTGFAKIKPQLARVSFTSRGEFSGVFTNGVGTTIEIKGIYLEDEGYWNISCQAVPDIKLIESGKTFNVRAENCGLGEHGGIYNLKVRVDYELIDAEGDTKTDSGTIRGPFE